MTDLIYVLLPLWQSQFGLSFAFTGAMRGLYAGCMAGFQVPASQIAKRSGRKTLLVAGTALAAVAYLLAGLSGALLGICLALALGGLGASVQHPLASALVADAYAQDRSGARSALASYNFAGDLGKMALPAAVGLALSWWSWQQSLWALGLLGLAAAGLLAGLIPKAKTVRVSDASAAPRTPASSSDSRPAGGVADAGSYGSPFLALLSTGMVDSATRMGFLTFMPFVLKAKGAQTATIGLALTLLFVGGALGKLFCGYLGARIGMMKTVWLTEGGTALLILTVLALPLAGALAALPVLGLVLNGTSSVLYGCVPDLVPPVRRDHAFAIFYTGTIGAGALSPWVFGWLGDHITVPSALRCLAVFVGLTVPLVWIVNQELKRHA